jgi:uncharacterized 2Fe-2S/4Fe-4S cluster protein (DUF4445 family)
MSHKVVFFPDDVSILVEEGATIDEAARLAGVYVNTICGGDGLCGKCRVVVKSGDIKTKATALLEREEIRGGYVLACQSTIHSDVQIDVPPETRLEGRPKLADEEAHRFGDIAPDRPGAMTYPFAPLSRKRFLDLAAPSLLDNDGDLERVFRRLNRENGHLAMQTGLYNLRRLAQLVRDQDWQITVTLGHRGRTVEVVEFEGGDTSARNYGIAVDVGTTTIVAQLIDLANGKTLGTQASYNSQVRFGEDVISRILYASEKGGLDDLQRSVISDINNLIVTLVEQQRVDLADATYCVVAGNTTMIHLMLGLDPGFIRCEPYIPTANQIPAIRAAEVGITISGRGLLQCMPGVGAYVGSDVVADLLASGMHLDEDLALMIDIGTNGEVVLGNKDWLICCSASAGPSFEGGGMRCGLRATEGAIERVAIGPGGRIVYRTIGGSRPRGICGSGMIDLVAELFRAGYLDKRGRFLMDCGLPGIGEGPDGPEFVLVPAVESMTGKNLVVTETDLAVFIRSKGAIYTAAEALVSHPGLSFTDLQRVYIAGGFGYHLDIGNSITIGLVPDLPRERFHFLGNGSLAGARLGLLSQEALRASEEIAERMTYFDLSTDVAFMNRFTSSLFLPHTDVEAFPSVVRTGEPVCRT